MIQKDLKNLEKHMKMQLYIYKNSRKKKTFTEFDDLDDIGKWMKKVEEAYFNFPDRISLDKWREL